MRFLVLVALCLAVANAAYSNRRHFNQLLRQLQQQQQWEQGWNNQGYNNDDADSQEEDDDEWGNQQQCQGGNWGNQQNCQNQRQSYNQQWQNGGQQWQSNQQQQQHHCSPRHQHLQALHQANNHLAAKLYQQAKQENDDKNVVVSPTAVQLALAAIQRGARGNTRRQIQRIIGAGLNQQQSQQAHAALQQSLQGNNPTQHQRGQHQQAHVQHNVLIVVNQQTPAQQQFVQAVRACTNANVRHCNFQRHHQQCRQQINQHIAQRTNNQLQQAVPQAAVTSNTQMLIVNTAHIRANWGRQVRNQQTHGQGVFHPLGSQQSKRVQTLQTQGQFNYHEDEQLQVVGLPTQQNELTLYVIVPKDHNGLNQVEKEQIQNGEQLNQLLEQAEQNQEEVQVQLPQFQIRHKIDAKQSLQQQGIQDAFDADQADFTGINHQQNQNNDENDNQQWQQNQWQQNQGQQQQQQQLHINKLIHQATIQVSQQGIHAARGQSQQQWQQQQWQQQQWNQQQWNQQQQWGQNQDDDEEDNDNQGQQHWSRQQHWQNIIGQNQWHQQGQQSQWQGPQGEKRVQANHAFAFALKHNPSNQIVLVGRVVDPTQHPRNQHHQQQQNNQEQSINGVDQQ